jgi:dipeptidyl aminopeptidase/acylaminoacyl peptidase
MKPILLYGILLISVIITYGQNSVQLPNTTSTAPKDNRWSINEYIWSHTNPQPTKKDKPILDFEAIDNWISLSSQGVSISSNGMYFVYGIQNNLKQRLDTVVIQSTLNDWRAVLSGDAQPGFFSADSRQYIFQDKAGLCFLLTGSYTRRYAKNIESYKTDGKKEWVAYRLSNSDSSLVLLNLATGKEKRVSEVVAYNFDGTGSWLVCQLKDKQVVLQNLTSGKEMKFDNVANYSFDGSGTWFVGQRYGLSKDLILYNLKDAREQQFSGVQSYQFFTTGDYLLLNTYKGLDYVDLGDAKRTTIWSNNDTTSTINSMGFDKTGKQVFFVIENDRNKAIWYWRVGMDKAEQKVDNKSLGLGQDMLIQAGINFIDNGHYIRFIVQTIVADPGKPDADAIQLDVWNYQDKILQSAQPNLKETEKKSAILDTETGRVAFPEREYEKLGLMRGDYALIYKSGKNIYGDRFWEKGYYEDSIWLTSLKNGTRHFLSIQRSDFPKCLLFTSDGQFLVFFNAQKGCNFFSYEFATGKLINISNTVPAWLLGITRPNLRTIEKPFRSSGIKLWLKGNTGILVYDDYGDIWQLDPTGKKPAVCITNRYGRLHDITFNLLNFQGSDESFLGKDTLLLSAFNRKNKLHGFYRTVLGSKGDLELLNMDNCYMEGLRNGFNGLYPLKAMNTNIWIVNRQSSTEAPNYFLTHDFKTFKQLTNLQPHKDYNWLTTELHSFKQLDGTISQGVLYKPENFNPTKKYPVIISFYGNLSDQLYKYPAANYITCPAIFDDPAWMVSHGYLVFIPDIYFLKDQWGPSTVNSVDGAARYLGKLLYVDKKHIGAAGHSNSGRFGYYLLTHSKSFSAIAAGSGFTGADVLSGALSLRLRGKAESCLEVAEIGAFGTALGKIWENKARWIDHIAPLQADKATSPFLLFHNKKDNDDVRLAVELFIAFRRLEKKAWWLQYDNGGHVVIGNDAKDWTIRYTQFFDHYLKGAPAPRWMTRGIQAIMKGLKTGYELDPLGSCAIRGKNFCNVCNKWNERFRKDTEMVKKSVGRAYLNEKVSQKQKSQ